jgi:hypothetical protein
MPEKLSIKNNVLQKSAQWLAASYVFGVCLIYQ